MDNRDDRSTQVILQQMAQVQRRGQRLRLFMTAVIIVMAAALIISLAILVPKLSATMDHARLTLSDTQQVLQRISTSLDNLDNIGEKLGSLAGEDGENLDRLIESLSEVDVDALIDSIQRFNSLLEGLSSFRLFG